MILVDYKILIMTFPTQSMYSFFTIAGANQALPGVIKKFEHAISKKNEVLKLQQQLQTGSATDSISQYMTVKQKLNAALTQFYKAMESLEGTGVMVKSLDQGLLDFPSKRFDEEVWLCWKYGETKVKFWHDKNSGFMGRKPVEVSDESLV